MIHSSIDILQIFSISMIPAAFFIRLWRHSVATFLFVMVAGMCSFCAALRGYEEPMMGALISLVEIYLVFRAVMRTPSDEWFPHFHNKRIDHV